MKKDFLVGKTEVLFNKKKLLKLLQSARRSNVVAFSIKHYNTGNDVVVSYEAATLVLNTDNCKKSPEGSPVIGYSAGPCPYPPGCNPTGSESQARLISTCLDLEGTQSK